MSRNSARLFFALCPGEAVRNAIRAIQARLEVRGRAVPTRNLHLTLCFLGNVPRERVPLLEELAAGIDIPAGPLLLDRLGCFEGAGVAWLGCTQVPPAWSASVRILGRALADSGFAVDARPWVPHVSLYRNLRTMPANMAFEAIEWRPETWCLMRSDRGRTGPKYTQLACWPCAESG